MSRDFEGNKAFYRAVFGYDYDDMSTAGFTYAAVKVGGAEVGGIGELGPEGPGRNPGALVGLLCGRRHGRHHRGGGPARRQRRAARVGEPVGEDGRGQR